VTAVLRAPFTAARPAGPWAARFSGGSQRSGSLVPKKHRAKRLRLARAAATGENHRCGAKRRSESPSLRAIDAARRPLLSAGPTTGFLGFAKAWRQRTAAHAGPAQKPTRVRSSSGGQWLRAGRCEPRRRRGKQQAAGSALSAGGPVSTPTRTTIGGANRHPQAWASSRR